MALPLRILSYTLVSAPKAIVWWQDDSGVIVQHLGFMMSFNAFALLAVIAVIAAITFTILFPNSKQDREPARSE